MKDITRRIIGSALFVALWTTQTASAWYDPSTGRWLTRDPIEEPGFQALQRVAALPQRENSPAVTSRWINRDPIAEAGAKVANHSRTAFNRDDELNLYCFVANNPINSIDALGLEIPKEAEDCYVAHPLYPDDPACDKYGERKYLGASLKCFCKFLLLRDTWSNYVRGCLACMDAKGVPVSDAHKACYASGDKNYKRPTLVLAAAWCACRK